MPSYDVSLPLLSDSVFFITSYFVEYGFLFHSWASILVTNICFLFSHSSLPPPRLPPRVPYRLRLRLVIVVAFFLFSFPLLFVYSFI